MCRRDADVSLLWTSRTPLFLNPKTNLFGTHPPLSLFLHVFQKIMGRVVNALRPAVGEKTLLLSPWSGRPSTLPNYSPFDTTVVTCAKFADRSK